jgi:hypothetical protein
MMAAEAAPPMSPFGVGASATNAVLLELPTDPGQTTCAWPDALLGVGVSQPWHSAVCDGLLAAIVRVNDCPVRVRMQDVSHNGGWLGATGGETIARTTRRASNTGVAVIGLPQSGGARVQQGVAALAAYSAIFRRARPRPRDADNPGAERPEHASAVTVTTAICSNKPPFERQLQSRRGYSKPVCRP